MRWHKGNTQLLIASSGGDRIEVLDVAKLRDNRFPQGR